MKKFIVCWVSIYIITVVTGCSMNSEVETVSQSEEKPMIGLSIDGMVIERWQHDLDMFKAKAEELGYQVEITNAYEDSETQKEQIRSLVKEGAEAIVIIACEKDGLSDLITEVKKEGVVVIAYDRLILNANVDAYISFDNVKVGELMAEATVQASPAGNYVIINGSPSDYNATMFNEGYYNVLGEYMDNGSITVIEETWAEDWREDYVYEAVGDLMEQGVEINAIIGANDRLAEAAISVLSEYGEAGRIPVVGHDADISACQRIVEGKQLMTVYKPIKVLAEGAVDYIDQVLSGQAPECAETINDGTYDVPYVKFDVTAVTKENMRETVIEDMFHKEEDIYR